MLRMLNLRVPLKNATNDRRLLCLQLLPGAGATGFSSEHCSWSAAAGAVCPELH